MWGAGVSKERKNKQTLAIIELTVCLVKIPDKQKDNYNYKGNWDDGVLPENKRDPNLQLGDQRRLFRECYIWAETWRIREFSQLKGREAQVVGVEKNRLEVEELRGKRDHGVSWKLHAVQIAKASNANSGECLMWIFLSVCISTVSTYYWAPAIC